MPRDPALSRQDRARRRRKRLALALVVYLVLLAVSTVWVRLRPPGDPTWVGSLEPRTVVQIPAVGTDPASPETMPIAFIERGSRETADLEPIILLHGSPGDAGGLALLANELDRGGRWIIAVDLPGFGASERSPPAYSIFAHAEAVLAMMHELGIDRAHVVGWSNGGGVAIHMADLAPDRIASMTLLAAIGAQETEGSGSYWFEHAKYALAFAVVGVGGDLVEYLVPHFGLAGEFPRWFRYSFVRNFWETDQRPLAEIMSRTRVPTLILHGRSDFLTPAWGAEHHRGLMPSSRLVMLEGDHFLPVLAPDITAAEILAHATRHDPRGVAPLSADRIDILDPVANAGDRIGVVIRWTPWWVTAPLLAMGAWRFPRATLAFAAIFMTSVDLDIGVATLGITIGRILHGRRGPPSWIVMPFTTCAMIVIVGVLFNASGLAVRSATGGHLGWASLPADRPGVVALVVGVIAMAWIQLALARVWTRRGRQRLLARVRCTLRHEFWPSWVLYAPLLPWILWLAVRHRSLTAFTAANPGISHAGGFVGESKIEIMAGFPADDPLILRSAVLPSDPGQAAAMLASDARLGGYPVVVKPDIGERGVGVTIVRDEAQLRAHVTDADSTLIVQRFHPGPIEVGVFWIRDPDTIASERKPTSGRIFSVTRKTLPVVAGDGRRSVGDLVLADRRLRCQEDVLHAEAGSRVWTSVPAPGERITLGNIGNHARGACFLDGADLITPELNSTIDRLARRFRGIDGGGIDFGRFDLRAESEDAIRAGGPFGVIEFNGTGSESTNIYDPSWSFPRSIGVLTAQWSAAYRIGSARSATGHAPVGPLGLIPLLLHHRSRRHAAIPAR